MILNSETLKIFFRPKIIIKLYLNSETFNNIFSPNIIHGLVSSRFE